MAWSFGQQESSSNSSGRSFVDPAQRGLFKSLFNRGAAITKGMAPDALAQRFAPISAGYGADFDMLGGLTNPGGQIDAQTASLRAGLGRTFRDEIMPNIRGGAIASGGFGGGRQGVAEGVAAGRIADAYTEGHGAIVANANQTALQAQQQRQTLGEGMFNLGMQTDAFAPLMQLKNLLGNPNILNKSSGRQSSSQYSFGL